MKEVKPIGIKNYGSIPHLSNSKLGSGDHHINQGQERILVEKKRDKHDTILVFEKYDGSNVGIAKRDNKIYALTRSGYEAKTSRYKQHQEFAKWVNNHSGIFEQLLQNGERVTGEWLYQAHGIIYNISQEPVVFFDWFDTENKRKPFEYLQSTTLPLPRLLHKGDSISVEALKPILNLKTNTIMSEEMPEGMVYRVERKGKVDYLAKWVRPDFETGKYIIGVDEPTCNIGI